MTEKEIAPQQDDGSPSAPAPSQMESAKHTGDNLPKHSHHDAETKSEATTQAYWRENVKLLVALLAIWFAVSFGAGIIFVEPLNNFSLGGYPLGFWFAQQGAIYVFVALIFFYAWRMKKIERRFGVDDDA